MKYITIGGITLDDTIFHNGPVKFDCPGGNSIYSALGAKLWTDSVGIVGRIGDDYPQSYLDMLAESGIDICGITRVEIPNQHLWILYEDDSSRQFFYHRTSSVMDSEIDPDINQFPSDYLNCHCAHLSAMGYKAQELIARFLIEKQIKFSYDITQASLLIDWEKYTENFATKQSHLLLPSIEEIEGIYGKQPLIPLLKKLSEIGPQVVGIKLGSNGSIIYHKSEEYAYHVPIYPVKMVDPTGAGDAFCGGVMVGYFETNSVLEAAIRGTVSASLAIEDFGAIHLLKARKSEVVKRVDYLRKNVELIKVV